MKLIKARMRSVTNIQKITKAMKMVAAAKLRHDERRLTNGLIFARPVQEFFQRLPLDDKPGTISYISLTSDKGLCGGVNSFVSKKAKLTMLEEEAKGNPSKYFCIGGKGVATLKRLFADRYHTTFEEVTKVPWNFTTASLIAERIVRDKPQKLRLTYNRFKNMASYETEMIHMKTIEETKTMDKAEWSKAVDVYSFEPSVFEVWEDLHEFYYASTIFGCYLQSITSEQSSRMAAMDNASKNAGEMLEKLSMIYNRARQAKITTELCEIISGASALE